MFSAVCTMNTGSKKLQREVGSTCCGAQDVEKTSLAEVLQIGNTLDLVVSEMDPHHRRLIFFVQEVHVI